MQKLLKHCKSLVVLLLLCGCLVGFSSVSFAATFTGSSVTTNFSVGTEISDTTYNGVHFTVVSSINRPSMTNRISRPWDSGSDNTVDRTWYTETYEGEGSVSISYASALSNLVEGTFRFSIPLTCTGWVSGSATVSGFSAAFNGITFSDGDIGIVEFANDQIIITLDASLPSTLANSNAGFSNLLTFSYSYSAEINYYTDYLQTSSYLSGTVDIDQSAPTLTIYDIIQKSPTGLSSVAPTINNQGVSNKSNIVYSADGSISANFFQTILRPSLNYTITPNSTNTAFLYQGTLTTIVKYSITNHNDFPLVYNADYLPVYAPKVSSFTGNSGEKLLSKVNVSLKDIVVGDNFGSVAYTPNKVLAYLYPNIDYLYDGKLYLGAGETIYIPITYTQEFSFYRDSANAYSPFSLNLDYQTSTMNTAFTTVELIDFDPGSGSIESGIISGAVDEQTQQQQQQYEDLTDPGTTQGEEFVTGTDNALKDKIGIFTFIDTLLENLLGLFVPPDSDPILTLPGFSIEIAGESHQIWTDHSFNLASLDEDFSALLTAVRFGTVAVVYFALINFLGDTYLRIFAGGKEDD